MIPTLCELWELSYSSLTTAISLEVSFAQPIMSSPNTCKDWSLAKDIKNPYASFKRSSFAELCYFNSSSFCLPNSKFILFTSGRLLGSVWILWPPSPVLQSRNCPQCTQGESCAYFWSSFSTQPPPLANSNIFSFQNSFSSTQWNFLQHSLKKAFSQKTKIIIRLTSLISLLLGSQSCIDCCPNFI